MLFVPQFCKAALQQVLQINQNKTKTNQQNDQLHMYMFKMKLYVVTSFLYTGWPDSTSFYDSETAPPKSEREKK